MGHYYRQDGEPCYFVNGKDTTLREARKLNLVPSTTEVLAIIAKPQLVRWQVNQGILAALTLPRQEGWTEDKYLSAIAEDGRRQAQEAADRGSYIHDQLERDRNGLSVDDWCKPTCARIRQLLDLAFPGVDDWVAEASFAHTSGYGGRVDLHSPSTGIIVDFKGKDGIQTQDEKHAYWQTEAEPSPKRCDYDQFWQLGSYQQGLGFGVAAGANIFFSRTHSGEAAIKVWSPEEMQQGRDVFNATLELWKALKKFNPAFEAIA